MGIRKSSNIRIVSKVKKGDIPLEPQNNSTGRTPMEIFYDTFKVPKTKQKYDKHDIKFTEDVWKLGGYNVEVSSEHDEDFFDRIGWLMSYKNQKRRVGSFTVQLSDDYYYPSSFSVKDKQGKEVARFNLDTSEDDDILTFGIEWNDKIRKMSEPDRKEFLRRHSHFIHWVLNEF